MFLEFLCKKGKNDSKVSDKVYTHEEVLETLLGEIIKIDIGGAPDGSFYVPGLVLPDEKKGFGIYHRCTDTDRISIDYPYKEKSGIKRNRFSGSHQFEPWSLQSNWVEGFLKFGRSGCDNYQFESNPAHISLDNMLNDYGLTIDLNKQKIKEFN
jgi:hypothetical protein